MNSELMTTVRKNIKIGMSESDVLRYIPEPKRVIRHIETTEEVASKGNVQSVEVAKIYWSNKEGLDVTVILENDKVIRIDTDYCEDWKESEIKDYYVNDNFIKDGSLHECTRFNSKQVQAIWIESVEIIGGQVFLGLRVVHNWIDENNYEIGEVVHYENILAFSRIQKIGTAQRLEKEIKEHNDRLLKEEQELQGKTNATNGQTGTDSGTESDLPRGNSDNPT